MLGTSPRPFIGICMDDVTPPLVSGNRVAGYEVGLCVQTQGAEIRDNHVHNMCIGAYIDPGIGARFHDNRIGATNPLCLAQNAYGVYGMIYAVVPGTTPPTCRSSRCRWSTTSSTRCR